MGFSIVMSKFILSLTVVSVLLVSTLMPLAAAAITPAPETRQVMHVRLPNRKNAQPLSDAIAFPQAIQSYRGIQSLWTPPLTPPATVNFLGATLNGTHPINTFPPDTMGAVGPTQYVVMANGRIVSFNKLTGTADSVLDTTSNSFFQMDRTGCNTTTPRIRYDRLSGRWFMIMVTDCIPNRILIAVSNGGIIASPADFDFFHIDVATQAPIITDPNPLFDPSTCMADFPTLGVDAHALYIGTNNICGGSYHSSDGYVIKKSSLIAATPSLNVTVFRALETWDPSGVPQGVDNDDPAAAEGYFVRTSAVAFAQLFLRRVTYDLSGIPSISGDISISGVGNTSYPIPVPHQGGTTGDLDALDDRLTSSQIRNGSLWTSHNIGVDSSGAVPTDPLNIDRNGIRWYEITDLAGSPGVAQSGTIYDSTATNPKFYWIPSIMVSGQGHAVVGFNSAGANDYINAGVAGRLTGDTAGTMGAPLLYTNNTSFAYNPASDTSSPRLWGAYSHTSLDPEDDMTMWTIQEYCDAANSYGLQVLKIIAPPPATPSSATPSMITAGQASVPVIIGGTSSGGSGFYDPGAGAGFYHLSASITGVTVNSLTYTNPTSISLNLSTVGATPGLKSITVTNPDGQSVTTSNFIRVCPVITLGPSAIPAGKQSAAYTATDFSTTGATGAVTFLVSEGLLPTGMTLSGAGRLSGTPSATGNFPVTITATDADGCSATGSYTLMIVAAGGTDIVKIVGTQTAYRSTIQEAYGAAAASGDTIQALAAGYTETLLFGDAKTISLEGGFNADFSPNASAFTTIIGPATISSGNVTTKNIIVQGVTTVSGGSAVMDTTQIQGSLLITNSGTVSLGATGTAGGLAIL